MSTKSRKRKADERATKRIGKKMMKAYDDRLTSYQKSIIDENKNIGTSVVDVTKNIGKAKSE